MIVMKAEATDTEIAMVVNEIKRFGLRPDISKGESRTVIGLVGDRSKIQLSRFEVLPGVKEALNVESPYQLISKEYGERYYGKAEYRVIKVKDVVIGGDRPVYIAGPCAVESKEQLFKIAEGIKKAGAHILRGAKMPLE